MDSNLLGQVLAAVTQGAAGQAGQQACTALSALVTRLLGPGSAEAGAVEAARVGNHDPARLAGLLAERAEADSVFAGELLEWLAGAQSVLTAGGTVNTVSGQVSGTVVQARDVRGGIRLSGPPGPAA
jgi:hypothetical protein